MKISLLIFDLDGTLVDSGKDITEALNFAFQPHGFPQLTVEQTVSLVGEGLTRLVEKLLGKEHEAIKPGVLDRFIRHYSAHLADYTVPYPGVRETLELLSGYKKAVVSNKREDLSLRLLERLDLARYFDAILGSDSVGEKKPSPKPLLRVLEMLSSGHEEAVVVGDSTYDIDAGKAAGIRTIAVSYGFRDKSLLGGADCMIDSFADLVTAIARMDREGSCHGNDS